MPYVQLIEITKRFGNVVANDHVSLDIRDGEIHSLLGKNGAGKTTLMNILYGLYRADSGHILIDDQRASITTPQEVLAHRIGMVHQHFMLVPTLSVAENYAIGQTSVFNHLSIGSFERKVIADAEKFGLAVDPKALVSDLSVGQQQRVEIVRALGRGARILILDEPTAVLTPQESQELMGALKRLAATGTSIVFISHKLNEVMAISDRISVLRDGKHIRTVRPDETSEHELALMMIGRDEFRPAKREYAMQGAPILTVRGITVKDDRDHVAVRELSFELHQHEILGVAGVDGNGQTELGQALVGLRRVASGSVRLQDADLTNRSPTEVIEAGIGFVSGDRQVWGLFPELTVAENLICDEHAQMPYSWRGFLRPRAIVSGASDMVQAFDIRPADPNLRVAALSGGNKQKVVIARAFSRKPRILIVNQPTRGVDVGATEYIRMQLLDERMRGAAILLISADLDEVLTLSDRIAVMYEGRFMSILPADTATAEGIGLLMAGVNQAEQRPPAFDDNVR